MKIVKSVVASALLLIVGVKAAALPIAECRSICGDLRDETLSDASACAKAKKLGQGQSSKLFHGCLEARKKAFTQACVPKCAKAEISISSFDACSTANYKKHGVKYVEWCRKGYDSILTSLEFLLANHRPTKQALLEAEEPNDVPADVAEETSLPQAMRRELAKGEVAREEPVKSEEEPAEAEETATAEAKEEPVRSEAKETVKVPTAEAKEEPVKSETVEAKAADAKEEPVKSETSKVQTAEASEPQAKDVEEFNAGSDLADSSEEEDASSENEAVDDGSEL